MHRSRLLASLVVGAATAVLVPTAPALAADAPPPHPAVVGSSMPPGNSGFFSVEGQARGTATRQPDQFGRNVDDQRLPFWRGEYKDGAFKTPTGTPQTPKSGVRIYEDAGGVPVVYGDTAFDVWYGAGYAAGQQRLFLADAVRRMGRGTFAELVGPSGVPVDVQARTLTYSQADYDAMFAALPQESQDVVRGYAAGLDAWISHVRRTPRDLPAEYVLLSSLPEPWTVTDTLAAGVLITRTVASAGGNEHENVELLRTLQQVFGDEGGLGAFTDLRWQQDDRATVSVPPSEGRFDNAVVPAGSRDAVLRSSAAYALGLPPDLARGPGTGAFPAPSPPFLTSSSTLPPQVRASLAQAVESLNAFRAGLSGGSYAFAVSGRRTTTGKPMLVSGPQLGYNYPSLLWEVEVHGAGYDARGSTVPSLPTVGIGYTDRLAWGLTTGNSKTIDSFVETVRRTDGRLQYLHQGQWKDADCRTEVVRYRAAAQGVPAGPPVLSVSVPVCRTVHGPVVAYAEQAGLARSVQYAMYRRELETVNGILAWNRADTFEEFLAGVRQVTWNENVVYADVDGRIAYFHPGLFPRRSASWDSRFPAPGTGEHDWRGLLPFEEMPQVVDPAVGYVANWNNKPAAGWRDDYLDPASSRPAGRGNRLQVIHNLLDAQPRMSPDDLRGTEYLLGLVDQRAQEVLPLLQRLSSSDPQTAAALDLLRDWDGVAYDVSSYPTDASFTDEAVTDRPEVTVFARFMDALRDTLLDELPPDVRRRSDAIGSHVWDVSVADLLALRVVDPSSSSLTPSRDYLGGLTGDAALLRALDVAADGLAAQFGPDPQRWRQQHPRRPVRSLSGVIGPSVTMPYQDRGTWVHVVAFGATQPLTGPGSGAAAAPQAAPARGRPLPATGAPGLVAVAGLALLGGAALLRRRRR
jgi:penicillin G amidase